MTGTRLPTIEYVNVVAIAARARAAASHAAGCRVRPTMPVPIADPIATPAITAASVAANAYVVGPSVIARIRVHAISWISAANPEIPRIAVPSKGVGDLFGSSVGVFRRDFAGFDRVSLGRS